MTDKAPLENDSDRIAREQASKAHAEEKHRRQAGQDKVAPRPDEAHKDSSHQD